MQRFFLALVGGLLGFMLFAGVGYFTEASYETDSYAVVVLIGAVGGMLTATVIGGASEYD